MLGGGSTGAKPGAAVGAAPGVAEALPPWRAWEKYGKVHTESVEDLAELQDYAQEM